MAIELHTEVVTPQRYTRDPLPVTTARDIHMITEASKALFINYANDAVAELIEANKLLLDSTSNKMCFRNEKEREAYRRIQNALARVGGAA